MSRHLIPLISENWGKKSSMANRITSVIKSFAARLNLVAPEDRPERKPENKYELIINQVGSSETRKLINQEEAREEANDWILPKNQTASRIFSSPSEQEDEPVDIPIVRSEEERLKILRSIMTDAREQQNKKNR